MIEKFVLNLHFCQIEKKTAVLDLSGSALSSLTTVLSGLPSLRSFKRLDLSRNELTSLRPLCGLPVLEHLNVSSNRLSFFTTTPNSV
jgi:Leucine-rich repeat (LRR) protein